MREGFAFSQIESEFYDASCKHAEHLRLAREEQEGTSRKRDEELRLRQVEIEGQRKLARRAGVGALVVFSVVAIFVTRHDRDLSRREAEQAHLALSASANARDIALRDEAVQLLLKARQAEQDLQWDDVLLFAAEAGQLEGDSSSPTAVEARAFLGNRSAPS